MKRAKRFFVNAFIMSCTTVFLRGAEVMYNVYITNRIGAEGIGLFGLIMSVYMLATTVASSGAELATTRLITEEKTLGCDKGARRAMVVCLLYTLFFGLLAACLLISVAPFAGRYWLGDERTIRPLYLLSVSLPFLSLSSALNGYFMAVRRVAKSASARIFELMVKVLVTTFALKQYADRGMEYACMAVVGGGSVAEICSFFYLYVLYGFERRRKANKREQEKRYTRRLLHMSLPLAISSYLRSGLVTVEHLLVPRGLKKYGASASASLAQYGVVHGMVMPILLFPSAILGAFSGLLIPELTEFQKRKNEKQICRIATKALRTTLFFSIGAAGIFWFFANEIGMAIYKSGDAGLFIKFLAPLVLVMYTDHVVDSMLKGLNQQVYSMRYNIIDSAVSVVLIYTLLPHFGVNGYIAVIFITELLNGFLSINRLMKVTELKVGFLQELLLPCSAVFVAACLVRFGSVVLFGTVSYQRLAVFGSIVCTALVYVVFLYCFGCLKNRKSAD
ncbi:MAG: polysaccharide biosynthesis C-terminal domain-containing protein [Clostridia bacterium]|nr:polysaccharide biosynthesis C-terminal domain-containing protein [Clostridia bacterium]